MRRFYLARLQLSQGVTRIMRIPSHPMIGRLSSSCIFVVLVAFSASNLLAQASDAPGVQWSCAAAGNPAESMALTISDWAARQARDPEKGRAFRVAYQLAKPSDIGIVRDTALCARAGRAYARGASIPAFHYHVALVRVGQRYIAINVNKIQKAGEFLLEAVLDSDLHFLEWIGT